MPTITQLTGVAASADTDEMPVSQNGVVLKATRAQIVAGLQPQIALASGQLLGRVSSGAGAPEAISIGANLALAGGTLSAVTTPLNVAALPAGAVPAAADQVPIAQGGRNVAVSYDQFMAGLGGLGDVNVSAALATPTGGAASRRLADLLADAVAVESFGAKGDGVTDDTAALSAAVSAGVPLRLGPRTYVVNGQWTVTKPNTVLLGVAGVTVLRRLTQAGNGAWIAVQANGFYADGVAFDANGAAVGVDSWGVLVTSLCRVSDFHRCAFLDACGATLGSGLVIQESDPAICQHVLRDCTFAGNAVHGLWVQACAGVQVADCRAHNNALSGIVVDFNDPTFVQKAHLVQLTSNRCWSNARGISVGNYNATNTQPPVWGNANPDAINVLVAGNICHDNSIYGIAVSGQGLAVQGNLLSNNGVGAAGGAGILANMAGSRVAGNMVVGAAVYGIDCGGAMNADVSANYVSGPSFGINCGGGSAVRVDGNTLQNCAEWAVCANNVETDANGLSFNMAANGLAITGNWIALGSTTAGGVLLRDGPQNVLVADNQFVGTGLVGNCLWANTDSVSVSGNRFNFAPRVTCNPAAVGGLQQVTFPDIADTIMITAAPSGVQAMLSTYQAQMQGQISFVRVTAGGSGYTHATAAIGGTGSGAAVTAMISNGAVIGFVVTAPGSGYGPVGTIAPVTITGDGSGAQASAYAAPPLPEERRLRIRCNTPVHFTRVGSVPLQENWTLTDIDVPLNSDIEWTATWGSWRAGGFVAADYLAADGAGGAILRSASNGDVALHPNGTGHVRLETDSEAVGCTTGIGRGSPEGVIAAPPGSDWRNLNGGVGSTYWVKQTGAGTTGWVAIA